MKPNAELGIQTDGSLGGEKVRMTFDENSIAHIMTLLTDLYSDAELAVIREYSTNARDAHIEAGNNAPIEIFLPGPLNPNFRVKDQGVGMSVDDIIDIYSKYGASTKRGTNDQNGMLGLGCKSGLTYTAQFMITAVKGGVKTLVSVGRTNDGTGTMEIVDTRSTDESNGVEISVPTKHNNGFATKARIFFQFWEPGTVLIDGAEPKFIKNEGKKITDSVYIVGELSENYVVMGNVAYPLERRLHQSYGTKFGIVIFADMGEVNFTPSREALHYTGRTEAAIQKYSREFKDNYKQAISDDVSNADSFAAALARYFYWSKQFSMYELQGINYRGQPIKTSWDFAGLHLSINRTRRATTKVIQASYQSLKIGLTVTDFAFDKVTPTQKKKIKRWLDDNNHHNIYDAYLGICRPGSPWTDDCLTVSWEDIKKIKLERIPNGTGPVSTYEVVQSGGSTKVTEGKDIDASKPVYYFTRKQVYSWHSLTTLFPDATIIVANQNRWSKIERELPGAKHIRFAVKQAREDARNKFSEEDKLAVELADITRWRNKLSVYDETLIDDPDLYAEVRAAKSSNYSACASTYIEATGIARELNDANPANPYVYKSALKQYPLILDQTGIHKHTYLYINAVYAARKKDDS